MVWSIVQHSELQVSKMRSFYNQKGIYEIRVIYATWIEERLSREISTTREEEAALQFCNDLAEYIRISLHREYNYSVILDRLTQISAQEFYAHLKEGIIMERSLIGEMKPNYIKHKLELLNGLIKACDCHEFYQLPNLLIELKHNQSLNNECSIHVDYLKRIFKEYEVLKRSVLDELKNWQKQQIQIANEKHHDSLNQIQSCVEQLVQVNLKMLQLVESIRIQSLTSSDERLDELAQQIKTQQENLILNSFIVDNQPNRVIKTNLQYLASVRWLIGPKLEFYKSIINVQCRILSEADAAKLLHRGHQMCTCLDPLAGEIFCNMATMQYQEQNRLYSANCDLRVNQIQRSQLKGFSKFDEKIAFLFSFPVTVNGSRLNVRTISLPVVTICHHNQEPQAWAIILWDNAFSQIGRELSYRITWDELSKTLYSKFVSLTGRGYSRASENYLYEKLFQDESMMTINPKAEISWKMFCSDPMVKYSFTFFDWFYHSMKLIKMHLIAPWNANLIEGYISKNNTEEKLKFCKSGTFLLRFSDSLKGAITLSYVNSCNEVLHIQPWDSKDLHNLCLLDRLKAIEELTELYPTAMNKTEALDTFISPYRFQKHYGFVLRTGSPEVSTIEDPSTKTTSSLTFHKRHIIGGDVDDGVRKKANKTLIWNQKRLEDEIRRCLYFLFR